MVISSILTEERQRGFVSQRRRFHLAAQFHHAAAVPSTWVLFMPMVTSPLPEPVLTCSSTICISFHLSPKSEIALLPRACPLMHDCICKCSWCAHICMCVCRHDWKFSLRDVCLQRIWQFWHQVCLVEHIIPNISRTWTIMRQSWLIHVLIHGPSNHRTG